MIQTSRILTAVLCVLPLGALSAQELAVDRLAELTPPAGHGLPGQQAGTEQWIVHFKTRSFDLSEFRKAVHAHRPWTEVQPILARYRRQTAADQAAFKEAIVAMGGRVYIQYWIVNAAAIEVPFARLNAVRQLRNVARLEPNLPAVPLIKEATNAGNHDSDAVNALGFKGKGISTAIVDTGLDSVCGAKNRPHRTFYEDGDTSKTNRLLDNLQAGLISADNSHQHGTGVAGIAAGGTWGSGNADNGHAPHAGIVGISISNNARGSSDAATMAKAWQWVARDAVKHKIKSANNSYSGWPDPTQVTNQAMDATSLNADVMIIVAGGNSSSSTGVSQSNANGLAVGAVNPTQHTMATFSSRGPLSGDIQRTYPDIAACGVSTIMPDNDLETANYTASGTSMAAPQVCGAATLIRAAVPSLKADQTKAILLATALDISTKNPNPPYNSVNAYGAGLLRDLPALRLAQDSSGHGRASVTTAKMTWETVKIVQQGKTYRAVANWMRQTMTSKAWSDLNVEVLFNNQVIASSKSPRNLYEVAIFRATTTGPVIFRVTGATIEKGSQEFAWAFTEGSGPPIRAEYTAFGKGCPGGPLGQVPCISNSWTQTLTNKTTSASRIGILMATRTLRNLGAVDLYTRARTSTTSVTVSIVEFDGATGKPGNQVLASGTVAVGTTAGIYQAKMTPFLTFPTVKNICIIFDNADKLILPISPTGQKQPHFEDNGGWGGVKFDTTWQYQVVCDKGNLTPVLSSPDTPLLGTSFKAELSSAPPARLTVFAVGLSNTTWSGISLPWQFAAPCNAYVSLDLLTFQTTDNNGTAAVTLPIPNQALLAGLTFYNQYFVASPVNGFGLISSNAARGKIGEF